MEALSALGADGVPAFLVGDFNSPSHLDWTEGAVGTRKHVEFPLEWPVTVAMEEAGFVDSYREAHPDPVADPGLTWPALRPFVKGYNPARNGAPADRIDFVYAAGPARVIDSALVGEEGGEGVDIAISPWPTDHRGTVSTFEVEPAPPPTIVAVEQRLVEAGDDVRVTFHSPGEEGERVVVVPDDDSAAEPIAERATGEGSPTDGSLSVPTQGWEPGGYEVVLEDGAAEELAHAPVWVQEPGGRPRIGTVKPTYDVGDPIAVEWFAAPGNRFDWVGIYKRGADPNVAYYIMWLYTEATVEGTFTFDESAHGPWPLDPGEYSVYLLEDDSYDKIAEGNFTIRS
jgi:endonuclease/exonuclease/phosphatase family protein